MPIQVPVTQTGLEASIEAAAKRAGRKLQVNMGAGAKSIEGLSQPLGRITGKADQFTKSMEAANARVLAFGASVGVLSSVQRGFEDLVKTTIEVQKSLTSINSILGATTSELNKFKGEIFDVARNTEQSFGVVADAALELSRQGLKAEEVTKRLNDSLILSRLSGLGAAEAVAGLTAAINSFNKEGVTSSEVLNKLSAAAVSAAVSERDLIEGIKRSGSVAIQAGVSFDELVGVITAVQEKTARGGAVIGNSFKTIFTRIQSLDKLKTMKNLGVEVTDASGQILSATKLIQNLAKGLESLPDARKLQIAENLVGKFQIAPFLAILEDYNQKTSKAIEVTQVSAAATTEAYDRNVVLNQTLSAIINETTINVKELANTLGEIGVTDNLKKVLGFFSTLFENVNNILDGDGLGSKFAKGIVKGIGNIISGPGLAIVGAIIIKLTADLAKFGVGSLKTFFGLNKAAQEQAALQGQIASTLINNEGIQKQILAIENSTLSTEQKRLAQTKFFTTALNEQLAIMTTMQGIAARVTPGVMAGTRPSGRGAFGRGAGGFIPNYNAIMGYGSEQSDINRGVGGAPKSARPVTIPNFNFGGGKRGTMVANTSEYMVPNFAGTGGSAVFNQDMIKTMGLPAGARKIGAAGGYIPNFAAPSPWVMFLRDRGITKKDLGGSTTTRVDELLTREKGNATLKKAQEDFNKLSVIEKRNIKVRDRQRATLKTKGEGVAKYGVLFPDAVGNTPVTTFALGGDVKNPMLAIPVGTDPPNALYEEIQKSLVKAAGDYALTLGFRPDVVNEDKFKDVVNKTLNPGSVEGAFGTVFEAAFQGAIGKVNPNNATWDLPDKASIKALLGKMKAADLLDPKGINRWRGAIKEVEASDFKNSLSKDNIASLKNKIKNTRKALSKKAPNKARGYIPNFASPLEDAIGREKAAGLPINQIRVNQDASLRNAGNPMGLAVTNTRDEPTGAIPNFAKTPAGDTPAGDAFGGLVGKALTLQFAFSGLAGILGEVTEQNKVVAKSMELLNIAITASLVAGAFGGPKNILGGIGGLAGRGSAMIGAGKAGVAVGASDFRGAAALGFRGGTAGIAAKGGAGVLMGGLKVAGGALMRFAGPIGLLATAGFAAKKAFDKASGATDSLAKSQENLERMSEEASSALSKLKVSAEFRESFKKDNVKTANQVKSILEAPRKGGVFDFGGSIKGGFLDGKQMIGIENQVRTLLDQGVDPARLIEMAEELNQKATKTITLGQRKNKRKAKVARSFDQDEIDAFLAELQAIDPTDAPSNRISRALGQLPTAQLQRFSDSLDFQRRQKTLGFSIDDLNAQGAKGNLPHATRDGLMEFNTMMGEADKIAERLGMSSELFKASLAQTIPELLAIKKELTAIQKLDLSIAKISMKSVLDRKTIGLTVNQEAEQQLNLAKSLQNVSEKELILLEQKAFKEQLSNDIAKKRLSVFDEAFKKLEGIEVNEEKVRDIRNDIRGLSKDDLDNQTEMERILRDILSLTDANESSVKAMANEYFRTTEAAAKLLEFLAKIKGKQREIADMGPLQRAGVLGQRAVRSRTADQTAFDTEQEIEKANLEADKKINTLQRSLIGAGPARSAIQDNINALEAAKLQRQQALRAAQIQKQITDFTTTVPTELFQGKEGIGQASATIAIRERNFADRVARAEDPIEQIKKEIEKLGDSPAARKVKDSFQELQQSVTKNKLENDKLAESVAEVNARLNDFDRFLLEANAALREASMMNILSGGGLPSRVLTQQRNIAAVQKNKDILEPNSAIQLRLMQRSVRERFEESGEFDPLVQSDKLANTLVQASLNFKSNISDALVDAIAKGENLGDALRGAATSFLTSLSKAYMDKAISSIVGASFFNTGGPVTGGSGTRDDVPALLTGGEFVMRKGAVQKYGAGFMGALNAGQVPTMNRGGLFTPGSYGQGAMTGKKRLLDFATQGYTTGGFDSMVGGSGFASIALEPQSAALTMFGRRNSPQFAQEQASKNRAFGLYTQQINQEKQLKEREKQANRALLGSVLSLGLSFGLNSIFSGMGKKSATGGAIPYAAGVDTVPTMLSGGEFVMNAAATQRIGRGNLANLNSGGGSGGNGAVIGKLDELISVSDNQGETVINITVNSDGTESERGNGNEDQNNLAFKIRDVVKQVIDDEKRLGGSLRQARA